MKTFRYILLFNIIIGSVFMTAVVSMAQVNVVLDNQPMNFNVAPMEVNGRVMVPMRPIFEALGAEVEWDSVNRSVIATKAPDTVKLTIGAKRAYVNEDAVWLDTPGYIKNGSTYVPLRFVSEAMGADVEWVGNTKTVLITSAVAKTENLYARTDSYLQLPAIIVPKDTVIPVKLDTELSSATNRTGDSFTATVDSIQQGDAEFPMGTQVAGSLIEVTRVTKDTPGTIDLKFTEVWLPNGQREFITGSLISLDEESVTHTSDGRLIAKTDDNSDDRLKMIGIGAGAGLVIGKLLDKNLLLGGLLGASAGYIYNEYIRDQEDPVDVLVKPGTKIGVRLDKDLTYHIDQSFIDARDAYKATQ